MPEVGIKVFDPLFLPRTKETAISAFDNQSHEVAPEDIWVYVTVCDSKQSSPHVAVMFYAHEKEGRDDAWFQAVSDALAEELAGLYERNDAIREKCLKAGVDKLHIAVDWQRLPSSQSAMETVVFKED